MALLTPPSVETRMHEVRKFSRHLRKPTFTIEKV